MTTAQAIQTLKAAGFADARFSCGHVWFTNAAGKYFSVGTDYRAEVNPAHVASMIDVASKDGRQ